MLEPIRFRISFFVYNSVEDLINQVNVKQTIIYSNFNQKTQNAVGFSTYIAPSMNFKLQIKDFVSSCATLIMKNLSSKDMTTLMKTLSDVMEKSYKFIFVKVETSSFNNKNLSLIFTGQEIEGLLENNTVEEDEFKIKIIPYFYFEQKPFFLSIRKNSIGNIPNKKRKIKEIFAKNYKLKLISDTMTDNNPILEDINEYVEHPFLWLKSHFPDEIIHQHLDNLYFFDKNKQNQEFPLFSSFDNFFLNEKNGLTFVKKTQAFTYECRSLFLPTIRIGSTVTINPLSVKNRRITNGKIKGRVMNVYHEVNSSFTGINKGDTVFTLFTANML